MHYTPLYCTTLSWNALHFSSCTVLQSTAENQIALYCTTIHPTPIPIPIPCCQTAVQCNLSPLCALCLALTNVMTMQDTALHFTVLTVLHCTILYYTALTCTTLYYNALQCTVLYYNILHYTRPSKCPKFYTNRIWGEQNLRQKVRKFCQNLNRDKMTNSIKHTLTIQFSI